MTEGTVTIEVRNGGDFIIKHQGASASAGALFAAIARSIVSRRLERFDLLLARAQRIQVHVWPISVDLWPISEDQGAELTCSSGVDFLRFSTSRWWPMRRSLTSLRKSGARDRGERPPNSDNQQELLHGDLPMGPRPS